jgi:hypothetical protein
LFLLLDRFLEFEMAAYEKAVPSELPQIPESLWTEVSPRIKSGIAAEYERLPDKSEDEAAQKVDWMRACLAYLNLVERPTQETRSWWTNNFTGLMTISAIMALAFGVMGVWGLSSPSAKEATAGFLDIAKLFAGTLVGAAGATALVKR